MELSSGFGLRPRSIGEILDLVFLVYKKRFRQFAGIGLVLSFAQFLGGLLWTAILLPNVTLPGATPPGGAFLAAFFVAFPVVMAITLTAYTIASVTGAAITEDALVGRESTVRDVLAKALPRTLPALATTILAAIPVLLGLCLCLIPGFLLGIVFVLTVPLCYLENLSFVAAMKRSYELVAKRGPTAFSTEANWLRVVLIGLVVGGVVFALQLATASPMVILGLLRGVSRAAPHATVLGPQIAPLWIVLPLQFLTSLGQGLTIMIRSIPWTVLYYDILTRYEGRDLEAAVAALGPGAADVSPEAREGSAADNTPPALLS